MNDHEYQLVLDPASLPTEPLVEGAMTWAYEGQATWTDRAPEPQGLWWTRPSERIDAGTDPARTYGVGATRRYDALGRQWVLTSVDADAVADKARRYDEATLAMFGEREPVGLVDPEADEVALEVSEAIWLEPTATGTRVQCPDPTVVGTLHWNVDGAPLVKLDAPLGGRSRKVLLSEASCSATMVDEGWALTAAHCVMLGPTTPAFGGWCTLENLDENTSGGVSAECAEPVSIIASPDWALGSTGPEADYALISFGSWDPGVGYMPVSGASNSTLEAHADFARGFPRKLTDCSDNETHNDALTTDDAYHGRHMYRGTGDVKDASGVVIEYDTSTAKGMSGGPHYYCPTGTCGDGHYLTGVQTHAYAGSCTGNACLDMYSLGPKGPAIRSWVLAVIQ